MSKKVLALALGVKVLRGPMNKPALVVNRLRLSPAVNAFNAFIDWVKLWLYGIIGGLILSLLPMGAPRAIADFYIENWGALRFIVLSEIALSILLLMALWLVECRPRECVVVLIVINALFHLVFLFPLPLMF